MTVVVGSVFNIVIKVRWSVAEIVCTRHIGHDGECLRMGLVSNEQEPALNERLTAPGLTVAGENAKVPKRTASGQNNCNCALANEARTTRGARNGTKLTCIGKVSAMLEKDLLLYSFQRRG